MSSSVDRAQTASECGDDPNPSEVGFDRWTEISVPVVATSSGSSLVFEYRQDAGYSYLDDVSVTRSATATPEPAALALLATGLVGIAGAARRRRSRIA